MNKFLKRIRGTESPGEFYLDFSYFIILFLMSIATLVFGRGEQKWGGVFGISIAIIISLSHICRRKAV